MPIYFEVMDERPPDVSKRRFRISSQLGMNAIGVQYDREFKMLRFEPGAESRFKFQPRSAKYVARKRRLVASRSFKVSPDAERPLIMTGALRRAVRQRHIPRAYPTRVNINMATPSYAQMTPKAGGRPNLGRELTQATTDEIDAYQRTYLQTVEDDINSYREARRYRTG